MTKRRRVKKKSLSLYKINPDAAVSAFLEVDPKCLKKSTEKRPSPKVGSQSE